MNRILRIFLGVIFILGGFLGLFLPFLQGWLFLGMGVFLLAPEVPLFQRWVQYLERRFPWVEKKLSAWRKKGNPP